MKTNDHRLGKSHKLCNRPLIDRLFSEGTTVFAYPLRFVFMVTDPPKHAGAPIQIVVSVSKRNFKRAVDRNLLKRRIREAYRLNKPDIVLPAGKQLVMALMYTQRTILDYTIIENGIRKGITAVKKLIDSSSGPVD